MEFFFYRFAGYIVTIYMREVMCAIIPDNGHPRATDLDLQLNDEINNLAFVSLVGVPLSGIFPQSTRVTLFGHLRAPLVLVSCFDTPSA